MHAQPTVAEPDTRNGKARLRAIAYLRATDIFQDLSDEEIEAIHRFFPMSRCRRGTIFFHSGESGERLYILKEGSVVLYRLTAEGKRIVLGRVKPGTIFGELALAGLTMRECFAEAQEESLICEATKRDVQNLITERPQVAYRLLEVFGRRVLELEQRLEQIAYQSVAARLAALLLHWAESRAGRCVVRGYTHADLADATGAARQTVSGELKKLEASGAIRLRRREIEIEDQESLERIAEL